MPTPADPTDARLPRVSVVIPTLNEEQTIEPCLRAVIAQDYPRDRLEILVLDGQSSDRTRELVEQVAATSEVRIRVFDNPRRSVPAALNKAIELAQGEFLVRVDGHSLPDPRYVRVSVRGNLEHNADLSGGWMKAVGTNAVGHAVAAALESPFSMGNAVSWQRPSEPREVDSVPCGSYRLSALQAIGGFDEAQRANQDYEANYRLRRAGGRLMLLPDVNHIYVSRDSFRRLARQFARYGFYKARVMLKHPASTRLRHLIPAAGLASGLALAVASPWWTPAGWLLLAGAAGYAALLFTATVLAGRGLGKTVLLLPPVLATIHLTWAAGNLAGLLRWLPSLRVVREQAREQARANRT